MLLPHSLYRLAWSLARPLLPLAGRGGGKLARSVRGRAGVLERMEAFGRSGRDPARPLAWFHAPSVGEGLQARAVIESLRQRRPEVQIAYTFFSASAERFAATVDADFADYLPWDTRRDAARALAALRPTVLAYSKTDVWPELTRTAAAAGARTALLSATLPAGSSRLRAPARAILSEAYAALDLVAAITPADADRFAQLGVPPERRTVMGDARFDQVLRRAGSVDMASPLLAPFASYAGKTLVAGSTWPADEERILPAVQLLRGRGAQLRLILVPHEPNAEHLRPLTENLRAIGAEPVMLSAVEAGAPPGDTLVVDRIGVLGELYALADIACVGGGFGRAGLHSVLEPAAFGVPVVFGPRHANAREAAELIARGAAWAVADGGELHLRLDRLLTDAGLLGRSGAAALAYVQEGVGAAERGATLVEQLL